jgi:hypothetical protein
MCDSRQVRQDSCKGSTVVRARKIETNISPVRISSLEHALVYAPQEQLAKPRSLVPFGDRSLPDSLSKFRNLPMS